MQEESAAKDSWECGSRRRSRRLWAGAIVGMALGLAALLWAANFNHPFEGDQPAKAAQIVYLSQHLNVFNYTDSPDLYRRDLFSFYYLVSAALYRLIGGEIFAFMNGSSVAAGVVFFASMLFVLCRGFRVGPIWSAIVLANIPIVVLTFTYGNEVAWVLALVALAMAVALARPVWTTAASGACFVLAFYCRPDVLFIAPFMLAWWATRLPRERPHEFPWRRFLFACAAAGMVGLAYWAVVLRAIPDTHYTFPWNTNLLLLLAYLILPFSPVVAVLAGLGMVSMLRRRSWRDMTLWLLVPPMLFYLGNLASPKYIAPLAFLVAIPAAVALARATLVWRGVALAALAASWVFAVTPLGIMGPARGPLYNLPTVDGPCPAGSYATFYALCREGFFQAKQVDHIETTRAAYLLMREQPQEPIIVGFVSFLALRYVAVLEDMNPKYEEFELTLSPSEASDRPYLITRIGYFYGGYMNEDGQALFEKWLDEGRVRQTTHPGEALPPVIEIGPGVPPRTGDPIVKRIRFMMERFGNGKVFRMPYFEPEFQAVSWIPASEAGEADAEPIYIDEQFAAYDHRIEGGQFYSLPWPVAYERRRMN